MHQRIAQTDAVRTRAACRARRAVAAGLLTTLTACGGSGGGGAAQSDNYALETTRLCALVPARDPAAAAFPPTPPVKVFGTDLGWTYARDGVVTMVFGDSWQRIDICPLQLNDDSLATITLPPADWPGYAATTSIPDAQCPELTFPLDALGTSFAPIELRLWNGTVIPLGPLNTPVTAFHDGQREWVVFIVGGGQRCAAGACPTDLSAQAADLGCADINGQSVCADPTSIRRGAATQALYLYFGERVGPTSYVARAAFLTNKYLNLTARAVRAFDPDHPNRNDYRPGTGALLVWGRPGFDDQFHEGETPPYFLYLPLPLPVQGDRLALQPRYLRGVVDGVPQFGLDQAEAAPLYTGEFEPVNHAAVSYVEPLRRWVMAYGGASTDYYDLDNSSGFTQPVRGAVHARFARHPWGPWSAPQPILTNEQVAQDIVCGHQAPAGCLDYPDPRIRPACIETFDPLAGGNIYGANIIDTMTRRTRATRGNGPAADIFWNISTWHPYTVVLVKTHIEAE